MACSNSRSGKLTGWGVKVRLPGQKKWQLLYEPGRGPDLRGDAGEVLCTSLAGARAWAEDYARRGCETAVVEVKQTRGRSYRSKAKKDSRVSMSLF